ncbi:methylenetetrahydrofolate reductase [Pleionea sp. CnH1-48]|uniref:methylenetetrahydrofolate reductase n=1 Tax=Pleionea sp. CnH1-48 TaxID=2954494 RepID=UPI002096A3A8|nr:methylenetetrahydrofolate reductase [Pleionea sp. CnH1-48]MCO7224424.1 methylenetetrahydrofolate reductase [Pleionea sp. CnH1-48]
MTFPRDLWQHLNEELSQLHEQVKVSFEFFPAKSESQRDTLTRSVQRLSKVSPEFVSVTYGALNGNRSDTQKTIELIRSHTTTPVAAHLTCTSHSAEEIEQIVLNYWNNGVRHIVALRGDNDNKHATPRYALDLVKQLKAIRPFEISVAAYPETHPEASSEQADIDNLARKVEAGATRAITQFFFSPEVFLNFRDKVNARGIDAELVPGILPVYNFEQMKKFAEQTKVSIPHWMAHYYDGLENDATTRQLIGLSLALEQLKFLVNEGVKHFHFYTLNRDSLVYTLCHALGKRPTQQAA